MRGFPLFFTLQFNCIYCVWEKVKFPLLHFASSVFGVLAMQHSHPSLYSTKTLYHLYTDSF